MNVDQNERADIATTNFHEQSQTFTHESILKQDYIFIKRHFLYALRIYRNEKIPRNIAKEIIIDHAKIVNNLCERNCLVPFDCEKVQSEYMLFKYLKELYVIFFARTVIVKKKYELSNIISKILRLREFLQKLFKNLVFWKNLFYVLKTLKIM